MSQTEPDNSVVEEPFSLTLDHYGRMWLHAKLEGIEVAIDLADKEVAFGIMAEKMAECDFEYRPTQEHEEADNDDQLRQ
jgi:hypothetical protein